MSKITNCVTLSAFKSSTVICKQALHLQFLNTDTKTNTKIFEDTNTNMLTDTNTNAPFVNIPLSQTGKLLSVHRSVVSTDVATCRLAILNKNTNTNQIKYKHN